MKEMLKHSNGSVGDLTVAVDTAGRDMYDFALRAAYVREIKDGLGLSEFEPLPSPWTVEIEPTLLCNARCHFCSYEADIENFKKERMSLPVINRSFGLSKDIVMRLLNSLDAGGTTAGVFWSGGGDPLMWPDIVECVRYASSFAKNSVQTNGIGLARFFKNPVEDLGSINLLTVSVYADEPELHAEIAGVRSFEKVVDNLLTAKKLRDEYNLDTTIAAKVMVDANNYHRLPEIVQFYRELGLNSVGMREVQDYNYGGEGRRPVSVELTSEQKDELCKIIRSHDYKDSSLDHFATAVSRAALGRAATSRCFNATDGHFACVDAKGNVFLGNPEIGDSRYVIGNVLNDDWGDIWKGSRHDEVIRDMNTAQIAGVCASALCRHVKANEGVDAYLSGNLILPKNRQYIMDAHGAFL